MNLAFSTLLCDHWSAEEIIRQCIQYGLNGVELRETKDTWVSTDLPVQERTRIKDLFKESQICITNIGSSVCIRGTEDNMKEQETLTSIINFAGDLGAKGVRIFLGNFARYKDTPKKPLDYEQIVLILQRVCDYALFRNVQIWIETHNEFATGKVLRKLLNDVNRKNCFVLWDIIHPLEDGEEPEETLRFLSKQCVHIHIKDGKPSDENNMHDWYYTRLGEGVVPIKDIVELLLNNGYEGHFSLEWEAKWREELQIPCYTAEEILSDFVQYMKSLWEEC